jgi:putative oxidoreductase
MKITVTIVRVLMGLLYIFSSVVVLFKLVEQPVLTGDVKVFMDGVAATGYLMTLIKVVELICGVALVAGVFVPLTTIIIFPISLNIFLYHLSIAPEGAPVGIILLLMNLFVAYYYRKNYEPLFRMK